MPCARVCLFGLFCAALSFTVLGSVEGRSVDPQRSREFLRSEEAGRLRRGFQTSSLATARGFGKRAGSGTIPFVSNPLQLQESLFQHPKARKEIAPDHLWEHIASNDRLDSYPINFIAELIASRPNILTAILETFVDVDGDGFITAEELERIQ